MMITETVPNTAQVLGIAPQFLVDDLNAAIAYYRDLLGFELDFCYESFSGLGINEPIREFSERKERRYVRD